LERRRPASAPPASRRSRFRPAVRTVAAPGLAALLLASCAGDRSGPERAPVLLVTIDTLSADRVGCYGCPTVRTPHLDRLARSGRQVIDAISPAPITLPSHCTMLTGVDPPAHGVRDNGTFRLPDEAVTFAERLPADVPRAAFVGSFPLSARFGLDQGFDPYDDDFGPRPAGAMHPPERRANRVLEAASEWLAAADRGRQPFVWTHLFDPHGPYDPPPPWGRVSAVTGGGDHEGEIAFSDRELGRYLRREDADRSDRAATVLVVADHGESLGAHGELTHSIFVYDATQRVPLILAGPGVARGLERAPRPLRDVMPTLLALYGIAPPDDGEGEPLQEEVPERPAYVETKYPELMRGWSPLHGMRTSHWKYIRAPRSELYDLSVDPGELHNVIAEHPDVAAELSAEVDHVLASAVDTAPGSLDDETAERLRSLGYVATITPGTAVDARKDPKDGIAGVVEVARGQAAYLDRDFATAERHFLRALELDPDNKEAHSFLAGTYYGLGRFELSAEHARRSLAMEPHVNEEPVLSTLGEALLALDRPREALPHLTAALAQRPRDPKLMRLVEEARRRAR